MKRRKFITSTALAATVMGCSSTQQKIQRVNSAEKFEPHRMIGHIGLAFG